MEREGGRCVEGRKLPMLFPVSIVCYVGVAGCGVLRGLGGLEVSFFVWVVDVWIIAPKD